MFTIQRCVLMLLLVTVCSKARNAPEGGSRQLEEVATRRELGSGYYSGSCVGTCGGKTSDGDCWCDSICVTYGDCCYDYQEMCVAPIPENPIYYGTCNLSCGGKSTGGTCWCDTGCEQFGDCCADYTDHCSCQGSCNTQAISGCWCDKNCESYNDCCPDYDICKSSWRRVLEGVATRGELEKSDITATNNSPSLHPTDLPSSIPTESPTDSPKSYSPTESPTDSLIVGTDVAVDEITSDVDQERVLDALERRQHAADFIQNHMKVEYNIERRQHAAELKREVQMEEESSPRRQLVWPTCSGYCGYISEGSCWCDDFCTIYGNCCADYELACIELTAECVNEDTFDAGHGGCSTYANGEKNSKYCLFDSSKGVYAYQACPECGKCGLGTCQMSCGSKANIGDCYCDEFCTTFGDCCHDFDMFCGYSDLPSCHGFCGNYNFQSECWCDPACTKFGDCCPDYSKVCTRRELGEEENTERNGRRNLARKNKQGSARKLLKML